MKKALTLSTVLHLMVFSLLIFDIPVHVLPKQEIMAVSIRMVAAPDVKKTNVVATPKAVNTQQSAAPKNPPKKVEARPKPKPKPKPKEAAKPAPKKPKVVQKEAPKPAPPKPEIVKKPAPKPAPAPEPAPEPVPEPEPEVVQNQSDHRPPKLDKTPDKQTVIRDTSAADREISEENFLKALSFVEDLKASQSGTSAQFEGAATGATTINLAEQAEIALIKKHIERNWYKTPGTKNEKMAHIRIRLDRDGTVSSLKVVSYDGDQPFINSLKRAIRRSSPLPIPVNKYETFKEIDIHWQG